MDHEREDYADDRARRDRSPLERGAFLVFVVVLGLAVAAVGGLTFCLPLRRD